MGHEAAVQLMLQLCSKDSPAVRRISPCAYVIRIHGTAARPGASDLENAEWDEMSWEKQDGMGWDGMDDVAEANTWATYSVCGFVESKRGQIKPVVTKRYGRQWSVLKKLHLCDLVRSSWMSVTHYIHCCHALCYTEQGWEGLHSQCF